jgi:hypothetical protein
VRYRPLLSLRRFHAAPLFIALLSAVLLAGVREASCEMHGIGAALAGSPAGGAMTAHGMAAASDHHSDSPAPDTGDQGCDCTCIGACTLSAPLATPPAAITLRIALALPEPSRRIDLAPAPPPAREASRLLPFANGPPSALV